MNGGEMLVRPVIALWLTESQCHVRTLWRHVRLAVTACVMQYAGIRRRSILRAFRSAMAKVVAKISAWVRGCCATILVIRRGKYICYDVYANLIYSLLYKLHATETTCIVLSNQRFALFSSLPWPCIIWPPRLASSRKLFSLQETLLDCVLSSWLLDLAVAASRHSINMQRSIVSKLDLLLESEILRHLSANMEYLIIGWSKMVSFQEWKQIRIRRKKSEIIAPSYC